MSVATSLHKKLKEKSKLYWFLRENYVSFCLWLSNLNDRPKLSSKKKILFYHINSLGYSGTEKFLQILAKYLDKNKFDVYYLYPRENSTKDEWLGDRYQYLKTSNVILIPFEYDKVASNPPYFVSGMNPKIQLLINSLKIDLLVIPSAGAASYPFTAIKNIPIILLNIFGQPNLQNNIAKHICISKEVAHKIAPIVSPEKITIFPVPSEGPTALATEKGAELRLKYKIPTTDIVFGRIGRDDNNIFDEIGIEAFKMALKNNPNIHYLIMSPTPILVKKVETEKIPHVYFVDPSSNEDDIWAFHTAIDVLAHFRKDGESFGLNIVESMLAGNPIITHKSHIWNAHLEYLDPSFARIAEQNDTFAYAKYLNEFANLKNTDDLKIMGNLAKNKAEKLFLIENNIEQFSDLILKAIAKKHS